MPEAPRAIRVTVACSPRPRDVREWFVTLPPGATLRQALLASGLQDECPGIDLTQATTGIWGRKAEMDTLLADGDRVELYRPLLVDPKVARRERFRKQGARGAGLFAKRRPGAKPGD